MKRVLVKSVFDAFDYVMSHYYPAGMEEDAMTVARNIYAGINLGNTLESTGGETAWGAPLTSQAIIDYMKEMGFNAVRIPCSWNQYLEADGITIQPSWMARVTEVVDYCMNAGICTSCSDHIWSFATKFFNGIA